MPKRDESLPHDLVESVVSMLPVVGPVLGVAANRLSRAVWDEHQRRASIALQAALRISGLSQEDFADCLIQNPQLLSLQERLLWAAGINGHDETLKAMGRGFGDAVREPERAIEVEIILAALTDFGPYHRAILQTLGTPSPDREDGVWFLPDVIRRIDVPDSVAPLCVSALTAAGLVGIQAGLGGVSYHITELGGLVLSVLREIEEED